MENGNHDPQNQHQGVAAQNLTEDVADPKGQPGDGERHKDTRQGNNRKVNEEWRHLVLCISIRNDLMCHVLARPPRQQVPELVVRSNVTSAIEC